MSANPVADRLKAIAAANGPADPTFYTGEETTMNVEEIRFNCIRQADPCDGNLSPEEIVTRAEVFYKFVVDGEVTPRAPQPRD